MFNNIKLLLAVILGLLVYACSSDISEKPDAGNPGTKITASASPLYGTAPLSVSFNAGKSVKPEGEKLTYLWDFDDGRFSEGASSRHVFHAMGTYMVTLTVIDSSGREEAAWVIVIVN